MNDDEKRKIISLVARDSRIKLLYLFGSRSNETASSNSDYDFAVYFDDATKKEQFDAKINLIGKFSQILHTNAIDVVVLNDVITGNPVMAYSIIFEGILLHEIEPYKINIEPEILSVYFDYRHVMRRYGFSKI